MISLKSMDIIDKVINPLKQKESKKMGKENFFKLISGIVTVIFFLTSSGFAAPLISTLRPESINYKRAAELKNRLMGYAEDVDTSDLDTVYVATGGGDCPGLSDAVAWLIKLFGKDGIQIVGIKNAFKGAIAEDFEAQKIPTTTADAEKLIGLGSTPFGSSREDPFKKGNEAKANLFIRNLAGVLITNSGQQVTIEDILDGTLVSKSGNEYDMGYILQASTKDLRAGFLIDRNGQKHDATDVVDAELITKKGKIKYMKKPFKGLIITGGDDHLRVAWKLHLIGIRPVIVIPKSVDRDFRTQMAGYHTAAIRAARREVWDAMATCLTHNRVTVAELFGRGTGHFAFGAFQTNPEDIGNLPKDIRDSMERGAPVMIGLLPDTPTSLESIFRKIIDVLLSKIQSRASNVPESISAMVAVAEGFPIAKDDPILWKLLELDTGLKSKFFEIKAVDAHGNPKLEGVRHYILGLVKYASDIAEFIGDKELTSKVKQTKDYLKTREVLITFESRGGPADEYDATFVKGCAELAYGLINQGKSGLVTTLEEGLDPAPGENFKAKPIAPVVALETVVEVVAQRLGYDLADKDYKTRQEMVQEHLPEIHQYLRDQGVFWEELTPQDSYRQAMQWLWLSVYSENEEVAKKASQAVKEIGASVNVEPSLQQPVCPISYVSEPPAEPWQKLLQLDHRLWRDYGILGAYIVLDGKGLATGKILVFSDKSSSQLRNIEDKLNSSYLIGTGRQVIVAPSVLQQPPAKAKFISAIGYLPKDITYEYGGVPSEIRSQFNVLNTYRVINKKGEPTNKIVVFSTETGQRLLNLEEELNTVRGSKDEFIAMPSFLKCPSAETQPVTAIRFNAHDITDKVVQYELRMDFKIVSTHRLLNEKGEPANKIVVFSEETDRLRLSLEEHLNAMSGSVDEFVILPAALKKHQIDISAPKAIKSSSAGKALDFDEQIKMVRDFLMDNGFDYGHLKIDTQNRRLSLDFSSTTITDLTPFKDLKNLEKLNLFNTRITDLTPLKGLKNLERLDLSNTSIRDLTPLKHLTNLKELYLFYTSITNKQIYSLFQTHPNRKNLLVTNSKGRVIRYHNVPAEYRQPKPASPDTSAKSSSAGDAFVLPIDTLMAQLKDEKSDAAKALKEIYGADMLEDQMLRYLTALKKFKQLYPNIKRVAIARGGGRVVETGEHSDYHHGLVLNSPTILDTLVITGVNDKSDKIVINSTMKEFPEGSFKNTELSVEATPKEQLSKDKWFYYIKSTINQMHVKLNIDIPGLCILVDGRRGDTKEDIEKNRFNALPIAAGVSSSAALDVASSVSILGAMGIRDQVTAAQITVVCMAAENAIGFPCGAQDPWGSMRGWLLGAKAGKVYAQVMDCLPQTDKQGISKITAELVEMPKNLQAILINTGSKSVHTQAEFSVRLDEGMMGAYILAHEQYLYNRNPDIFKHKFPNTTVSEAFLKTLYPHLTPTHNQAYPPFYKPYFFSLEALNKAGYKITEKMLLGLLDSVLPNAITMDRLVNKLGWYMFKDIEQLKTQGLSNREAVEFVVNSIAKGTERPINPKEDKALLELQKHAIDELERLPSTEDTPHPIGNITMEALISNLGTIAFDRFTWTTREANDKSVTPHTRVWNILGSTRHAITEQKRVRDTVEALKKANLKAYGKIQKAVYKSLRDDYRNTDKATEALVDFANNLKEVFGARHIGAGWGGNVAVWVDAKDIDKVYKNLEKFVSDKSYEDILTAQILEQSKEEQKKLAKPQARKQAKQAVEKVKQGLIKYIPGPGSDLVFKAPASLTAPAAPKTKSSSAGLLIRDFGKTGLRFFVLGAGTIWFGRQWPLKNDSYTYPEPREVIAYLDKVFEKMGNKDGVVMIDTAAAYGLSEEVIGKYLKTHYGQAKKAFIATKLGEEFNIESGKSTIDHSKEHLISSVNRSLMRLGKIDLLYIHGATVDVLKDEDVISEMKRMRQEYYAGIHYIGASISKEGILETAVNENLIWELDAIQMPAILFLKRKDLVKEIYERGLAIVLNSPIRKPIKEDITPKDTYAELLKHEEASMILTGTRHHLDETVEYIKSSSAGIFEALNKEILAAQDILLKAKPEELSYKHIEQTQAKLKQLRSQIRRTAKSKLPDKERMILYSRLQAQENILHHMLIADAAARVGSDGQIIFDPMIIPDAKQRNAVVRQFKAVQAALEGSMSSEDKASTQVCLLQDIRSGKIELNINAILISDKQKLQGARLLKIDGGINKDNSYIIAPYLIALARGLLSINENNYAQLINNIERLHFKITQQPLDKALKQSLKDGSFNIFPLIIDMLPGVEAVDKDYIERLQRQAWTALIAA